MYKRIYYFLKKMGFLKEKKELSLLYPLQAIQGLNERYYSKIIQNVFIFLGIILIFLIGTSLYILQIPRYQEVLHRNDFGEGSQYYELIGVRENHQKETLHIEIPEKELNQEDYQNLIKKIERDLPNLLKGRNLSLEEVKDSLYLPEYFMDSKVKLSYEYDTRYIGYSGEVLDFDEEFKNLNIKVTCSYEAYISTFEIPIRVFSTSHKAMSLEQKIQEEVLKNPKDKEIVLPKEIDGESIFFVQRDWNLLIKVNVFLVLIGLGLFIWKRQSIEQELKKRQLSIEKDYPELVIGIMLFMGAGYTSRNALKVMVEDYHQRKGKTERSYLFEEIERACRELESGVTEKLVYRNLGERSRSNLMLRLTEILSGYLTKGNKGVLQLLEEEARQAMDQRKLLARKEGEEASIKLLGPMIGMLLVVMMILILPAFLQFQI